MLMPYSIGKYPVTNQEDWEFLCATGHTELPTSWESGRFPVSRANHPVYSISPESADLYALWLSGQTGRKFRLPSEAEWEFAAAGYDGLEFPWGKTLEASRCNTAESGRAQTTPIGSFPSGASHCGELDMAGNVEEYVADTYEPYPGGTFVKDDLVETQGAYRVARGGSFALFADLGSARLQKGSGCCCRAFTALSAATASSPDC